MKIMDECEALAKSLGITVLKGNNYQRLNFLVIGRLFEYSS